MGFVLIFVRFREKIEIEVYIFFYYSVYLEMRNFKFKKLRLIMFDKLGRYWEINFIL